MIRRRCDFLINIPFKRQFFANLLKADFKSEVLTEFILYQIQDTKKITSNLVIRLGVSRSLVSNVRYSLA